MSEQEAKKVVEAFVTLTCKAFDGDTNAQRAVMAYQEWFSVISKVHVLKSLLGGQV